MNEPQRLPAWPRVLHVGIIAFLFNLAGGVLSLVVLCQLLRHLFMGRPHPGLADFGHRLSGWIGRAVAFLTYTTDETPYPLKSRRHHEGGPEPGFTGS